MNEPTAGPGRGASPAAPCRVMVVDDSAVVRGFLARALESEPGIRVIEGASNGEGALRALARTPVDVILLDVDMPVMDGLTALPLLLKQHPEVRVIMVSTLTRRNAAISLRALAAGATDYLTKPTSARELHGSPDFRRELVAKVKALAGCPEGPVSDDAPGLRAVRVETKPRPRDVALREASAVAPEAVAFGSSTGGPQALFTVFKALGPDLPVPAFVTQHMPPTFTTIFAEHLARVCGAPCAEARDGEPVEPGRVYVAPGNRHMTVERRVLGPVVRLDGGPPENYCRPAVDPLLRGLAATYGAAGLGVILTGMGHDGLAGARAVVAAGGTVIAQDQRSSVVWGMPGAVAEAGLCSATPPLDKIAPYVLDRLRVSMR